MFFSYLFSTPVSGRGTLLMLLHLLRPYHFSSGLLLGLSAKVKRISPLGHPGLHAVPHALWPPSISDIHLVGVFGVPGTCEIRHSVSSSPSFLLLSGHVCGPPLWLHSQPPSMSRGLVLTCDLCSSSNLAFLCACPSPPRPALPAGEGNPLLSCPCGMWLYLSFLRLLERPLLVTQSSHGTLACPVVVFHVCLTCRPPPWPRSAFSFILRGYI